MCCTDAGIYGPFADATWQEGDGCAAVVSGKRVCGTACYSAAATGARLKIESVFALAECKTNAAHRRPMRSGNPLFTAR
jgi:hypothetical protein